MSKIASHEIWTGHTRRPLLDWVKSLQIHNPVCSIESQLDYAKVIAQVEDETSRKVMLDLLNRVGQAEKKLMVAGEDFERLHKALVSIDQDINAEAKPAPEAGQ